MSKSGKMRYCKTKIYSTKYKNPNKIQRNECNNETAVFDPPINWPTPAERQTTSRILSNRRKTKIIKLNKIIMAKNLEIFTHLDQFNYTTNPHKHPERVLWATKDRKTRKISNSFLKNIDHFSKNFKNCPITTFETIFWFSNIHNISTAWAGKVFWP